MARDLRGARTDSVSETAMKIQSERWYFKKTDPNGPNRTEPDRSGQLGQCWSMSKVNRLTVKFNRSMVNWPTEKIFRCTEKLIRVSPETRWKLVGVLPETRRKLTGV